MRARPRVITRTLLALTALALGVCSDAPAPAAAASKKASFVIPNLSFYGLPVVLAKEKGYFKDEGVDLEITTTGSGTKATAAIVGGSADFGAMEFSDMLAAVDKKQAIQAFAACFTEPPVSIVMKKSIAQQKGLTDQSPLADKLKALKGLKIAITSPGSGTDSSVRWSLLTVGLDPDRDVEIVPSRSAQNELAAFVQGQVDAFAQTSPWVELVVAKYDGYMVVSFPRGDVPAQQGRLGFALTATRDTMEKNSELITAATRAVWRALRLIHEQPEEAKTLAKQTIFGKVDPAAYDLAWKVNMPAYPKDPRISERHVQLNVEFKAKVTGKKLDVTFEQAATNKFVDAAAKTMR